MGRLEIERSRANYITSRAAMLPSLRADGSYSNKTSRVKDSDAPASESNGIYYSAGAGQPIFHWGAIKRQTDIAKLEILFQELNLAEAYQQLAVLIRRQYLGLIYQQMAVRNLRYASEMADDYLKLQESKLEAGTLPAGSIITPRISAMEARLSVEQGVEAQRYAAETLARLCGVKRIVVEELPETIPAQKFSDEVRGEYMAELAAETELSNTPQALFTQLRLDQDDLRYKIARTNLLPKIGISANYGLDNTTSVNGDSVVQQATTSFSYGVSVSWAIFDGLSTRGQKLSILASKRVNERTLKTYLEDTAAALTNLERQIEFAGQATNLAQMRYDLADDAVRLTRDNFKAGVASRNAVSGVTNNAYVAELALANARQNELMLWTQYISTAGLDPVLEQFPVIKERISHGR